jgi:hypothetical protein
MCSLIKLVTVACGALASMAVLGTATARADTTYFYTGSPYTVRTGTPADAAVFGTNLTGSITFHFDATGVNATFGSNAPFPNPFPDPTVNQFTSGDISWTSLALIALTLTNGAITDWRLGPTQTQTGCVFSTGPATCGVISTNEFPMAGDVVQQVCLGCVFLAENFTPGTWSPTPVPGPVAGSGVLGLLLALGGLPYWRQRRNDRRENHELERASCACRSSAAEAVARLLRIRFRALRECTLCVVRKSG